MKLLLVKTQRGLVPVFDSDMEVYSKIAIGEEIEIDYKKKRNLRFHKKYFALIKLAFENQSDYRLFDELRRDITIAAGFYDEVTSRLTGEIYKVAKSISFANMDEIEFSELYEKTKDVISRWIGISNETIEEEIAQYF